MAVAAVCDILSGVEVECEAVGRVAGSSHEKKVIAGKLVLMLVCHFAQELRLRPRAAKPSYKSG